MPIDPGLVRVLDAATEGSGAESAIARYQASQSYPIFQEITRAVRAAADL